MAPLDSPRWEEFSTRRGEGRELPALIRRWQEALGQEDETIRWLQIAARVMPISQPVDAACAVVPYVVQELEQMAIPRRLKYLTRLGGIERSREASAALPENLA